MARKNNPADYGYDSYEDAGKASYYEGVGRRKKPSFNKNAKTYDARNKITSPMFASDKEVADRAEDMNFYAKKAANSLAGERGREIRNIVNEGGVVNLEPMDAAQNAANMQGRANEAMREWANTNPEAYKQFIQSQLPKSPADMRFGINAANSQMEMLPEAQYLQRGTDYQPSLRGTNGAREGLFNSHSFVDRIPTGEAGGEKINVTDFNFLASDNNGNYPSPYRDMTGIRDKVAGAGNADFYRFYKPVAENFNNPRNLPRMPEVPESRGQVWPDSAEFMYQNDLWQPKSPADYTVNDAMIDALTAKEPPPSAPPNYSPVDMLDDIRQGRVKEVNGRIMYAMPRNIKPDYTEATYGRPQPYLQRDGNKLATWEPIYPTDNYTKEGVQLYRGIGAEVPYLSDQAAEYGQGSEYPLTMGEAVRDRHALNNKVQFDALKQGKTPIQAQQFYETGKRTGKTAPRRGYEIPAPSQANYEEMFTEEQLNKMADNLKGQKQGKKVEYKDAAMEGYPKAKGNNPKVQTGGMKYPEGKSASPFMIPAGVQAAANMVKGGNTTAGLVGAAGVLAAAGVNATMDTAMVVDGLLRMGADANRVAEFLASDEGKQYLAEQANDLAQRRLESGIE